MGPLELAVDEEPHLFGGERPAKGPLGKTPAEGAEAGTTVRGAIGNAGQLVQVSEYVARNLQRCLGRGPVPGPGNRRPAFITGTAVIRGKRRFDDERDRETLRGQVPLWDHLDGLVWRLPLQDDGRLDGRGRALFFLPVGHSLLALG